MHAILLLDPEDAPQSWRNAPETASNPDSIVVTRWAHASDEAVSVASPGHPTHHCIAIALRSTTVRLVCGGLPIADGRLPAGTVQVTPPGVTSFAIFNAPSDVLHLFVPPHIVATCCADVVQDGVNPSGLLDHLQARADAAIERLGQALCAAHSHDPQLTSIFSGSLALSIVSRVVALSARDAASTARSKLPPWRLRRALQFIDSNLGAPIRLVDIASSTGLTRMHFAAQFRQSTGMRPRDYLTRRRIEMAQDLLRNQDESLLAVAQLCGFRTQAHFTTVFKRCVGETPHCWRMRVTTIESPSHA